MRKFYVFKYRLKIGEENKNKALNLIISNGLKYNQCETNESHDLVLLASKKQVNDIMSLLKENSIQFEITREKGILSKFEVLTTRIGLVIGFLLMLIVLFLSSKIVWKIEIEGNEHLTNEEILEKLYKVNFGLGTYIPRVNYDKLHNEFLMNNNDIAWISVNISGNIAKVKIREKKTTLKQNEALYTNVVAKFDGYIASVNVINGKKTVDVGNVVKKGDLLISGIMDSQSLGTRYEHAKGEIKAYTNKKINIVIPLKNEKKVYTGNIYKGNEYKIYNFPLKFLGKYRNHSTFCDTIVKREKLHIFGISHIPLEVLSYTSYEYEIVSVNYTAKEAVDLAFKELRSQLDEQLTDADLISKTISFDYDDENFYIFCSLYCLENIAEEKEFYKNS